MPTTVDISFNGGLFNLATNFSSINFTITNGSQNFTVTERSNTAGRTGPNQFTVFDFFSNAQCATSYLSALTLDYINTNFPGISSAILQSASIVRITLETGWTVSNFNDDFDDLVTFSIDNDTDPVVDPTRFTTTLVARALDPCNTISIQIDITGGTPPFTIVQDGVTRPVINNRQVTYPSGRNGITRITVTGSEANAVPFSRNVTLPDRMVEDNFSININQAPNGSTVTVISLISFSNLEYSLNGVDFQSSNTFANQAPGDYNMRIRDAYGCTLSIQYTISDISPEPLEPFFLYPEANMIRMYKVENDTASIRANYYNRESCNEYTRGNSYQNIQYWEEEDSHIIQLKTNHSNPRIFTISPDGTESELALAETVQNIGLKDGRDGKYFRETQDTIGLYFDSGNTYDYDTRTQNGTYALSSGLLPSFIVEGVFVDIVGLGFKEVLATAYDTDRQRWYAVLSGTISEGADIQTQVYTIYNNQVYNVYTSIIPMSSRLNTNFKYKITTDLVEYKSEEQRVVSEVKGVVIDYSNSENKYDVVYVSGPSPRFRLRFPDMDINKLVPDSEVENYNSDDSPIQLDNKIYKNFEIRCEDLSTAMAFKALLALMHDIVTVNGLQMTFKEISEFEPYENTNLYSIRILMIEGGNAAARQQEQTINLTTATAIRLEAELGLINYSA